MAKLTSNRPYLIRALYEWLADNGLTPLILVDATYPEVHVPLAHVQDGKIILNIAMAAVQELQLGNEMIEFRARFSGKPEAISVPVAAVQAIYARENSTGMAFPEEVAVDGLVDTEQDEEAVDNASKSNADAAAESKDDADKDGRRSHLRVIK